MRSAWIKRLGLATVAGWLAVAGAVSTSGCAASREEINRVQPNYVKKSDLVGDYRDLRGAPEWYMRSLVLGVQRTNPFTSDGLQDLARRVRFEITEGYLVVRRSHELIANTDGKGGGVKANTETYTVRQGDTAESIALDFGTKAETIAAANPALNLTAGSVITLPGKANTGTIVAVYPITSQFDIKRSYNPATGEETNVLEENGSDRRWFEREYMRVDWSRNLAMDPDLFEFWFPRAFGELNMQNVQYYETKPDSPERSNLEEMGTGYFDLTSRWLVKPQDAYFYGEKVPQCLLWNWRINGSQGSYADGTYECNDQEVVLRTAFKKIEDTDYEVFETEGQQQHIVGTLELERYSYDRQYGLVDQKFHKFVQRYNIWDKSHLSPAIACGENGDRKKGDETCEGLHPNSVCDLNTKTCNIPYAERRIRPLVFFGDQEIPARLVPGTAHAVEVWDEAIQSAVAYAREAECRRLGEAREVCHGKYFVGDGKIDVAKQDKPKPEQFVRADGSVGPVVVFCHNPVTDKDDKVCGPVGKKVRKGDIRYHMLAYWANPSIESPLGVVVWPGDPLTGENVGSMANVFGGTFDHAVAYYRDMIQLVNGDVTPSEFVNGEPEMHYGDGKPTFGNGPTIDPALNSITTGGVKRIGDGMTKAEIDARTKGVDPSATAGRLGLAKAVAAAGSLEEKVKAAKTYFSKQGVLGTPGFGGAAEYSKRLSGQASKAVKHGMEPQIVNDKMTASFGIDPKLAGAEQVLQQISPLRMMRPDFVDAVSTEWERHWASRACHVPSFADGFTWNHFDGIAAKFKARYPDGGTATGPLAKHAGVEGQTIDRWVRGKLIYHELIEPVYVDVLLHEMGHAFSFDHDFGGTWDSVNYFPQYWQLRTADGKANKVCPSDAPRSKSGPDTCTGPRYLDPISDAELGLEKGKEHDAIEEYATASIMDYHADSRYWPGGLGLYDRMAAKFIYGRVVETFDDPDVSLIPKKFTRKNADGTDNTDQTITDVQKAIAPVLESMLGGDWRIKRNVPGLGNFAQGMHYTEVSRMLNLYDARRCRPSTAEENASGVGQYGKVCQPPHRDHFLVRDMESGDLNGADSFTGYWKSKDGGKVRWPYKFGPGRFANYPHIAVFDSGGDFYEVTQDLLNWYEFYYLNGFFRKHMKEYKPFNVQQSLYGRVYRRFHLLAWDSINSVVRYQSFFPDRAMDSNPITISDDWGRPEILGLTLMFDSMQRALLRPQPGNYKSAKVPGMAMDLASVPEAGLDKKSAEFSIGGLDARYIDNAYDVVANGYDYQASIMRVGSYTEKPLAAIALTDSRPPLSTISRETYLDGRNVMFSFRSALPKAFDRLIGGVFAEDWDTLASYVVPTEKPDAAGMLPLHNLQLWSFDDSALKRAPGAKLVDPMLGFRTMVPTMLLTFIYQPIDSNMELIQRSRIWVEGASEEISIPPGDKINFYDPGEGLTWGATKFGTETIDGRTVQIGIGARMLEHANRLLGVAYNVKTDTAGLPIYGTDMRPALESGTTPVVKNAAAAARLKQYVGFLNTTRWAMWKLGFGPLRGGWDDD